VTAQQTRWFIDNNIKSTVRQCFRRDLNKLLSNLIRQKHKIVIGGDFNEHSAYNNILQDITEKHKLIDIISISDDVDKPTYKHGPHVLDKMFLSRELLTSQTKAQLEDYNSIEESDHRPISACTWINYINHLRKLNTNNLKALTTYIQKVYLKMESYNMFQIIQQLSLTKETTSLDKVDKKLTRIKLEAEKEVKQTPSDWWHKDIIKWKQSLRQLNKQIKCLRQQYPRNHNDIGNVIIQKSHVIQKFKSQSTNGLQRRHTLIQEEITKLYQDDPINKPKIQYLKQLLRTEVIREIYKKLKFKVTRITTQQHSIQILNNDNTTDIIVDHQEISRHIAEYNTQHFQQASRTMPE
jgi:Endonuclease-reverse transcriptase